MHPLHELLESERPRRPPIQHVPVDLRGPQLIGLDVILPATQTCRIGREAHALFAREQRFFRLPALVDVDGHPAHAEAFPTPRSSDLPARSEPARTSARHHQAIFGFIVATILT